MSLNDLARKSRGEATAFLGFFHFPLQCVGHVDGVSAKAQHGQDVALERVAYHAQLVDAHVEKLAEVLIFACGLVGHHYAVVEEGLEPRPLELVFLVEIVALGEHHHLLLAAAQGFQRLRHARQWRGGHVEQALAHVDDSRQGVAPNLSA